MVNCQAPIILQIEVGRHVDLELARRQLAAAEKFDPAPDARLKIIYAHSFVPTLYRASLWRKPGEQSANLDRVKCSELESWVFSDRYHLKECRCPQRPRVSPEKRSKERSTPSPSDGPPSR